MEEILRPELAWPQAFDEFLALLSNGTTRSRNINGQWCVAAFTVATTEEITFVGLKLALSGDAIFGGLRAAQAFLQCFRENAVTRAQAAHVEGGYSTLAPVIDDHVVVHNEHPGVEPVNFTKLIVKDAQRQHNARESDLEMVGDGLVDTKVTKCTGCKPLWALKMDCEKRGEDDDVFTACRCRRSTRGAQRSQG